MGVGMSTRRQRSRPRTRRIIVPSATAEIRNVRATVPVQIATPRRTRDVALADLTRHETQRRLLEEARPLLALAVAASSDDVWPDGLANEALLAAVRLAGPCPAGWCRYPHGHTGDHEPLEAA